MDGSSSKPDDSTHSFDYVLAEYLRRVDSGEIVDRESFLALYPDHADELREMLATSDLVERMAGPKSGKSTPLSQNEPDTGPLSAAEAETMPPGPRGNSSIASKIDSSTQIKSLGRYEILKTLGQGGMGAVYQAYDPQLDRKVAIKVPLLSETDSQEVIDRFRREAKALATIDHPNICPVFDVSEAGGTQFITMPYVEGKPLSHFVQAKIPLSIRQIVLLVRKLALALEKTHRAGVIHRDLKPANVMINQHSEPVIMDFGLARREGKKDTALTETGQVMGTPAYMSPEQISGQPEQIGPACDVFSLGVILYELLTSKLPFGNDLITVVSRIVGEDPAPPSAHRNDITPALDAICLRAMSKEVKDRYHSMAEFSSALTNYLKGNGDQKVKEIEKHQTQTESRELKQNVHTKQPMITTRVTSRKLIFAVLAGIGGVLLMAAIFYELNGNSTDSGADQKTDRADAPFSAMQASRLQRDWAAELNVDVKWTNSIGMEFSLIPPGEFLMGSTEEEIKAATPSEIDRLDQEGLRSEIPKHQVQITRAFYIGAHEVTQHQFETITGFNPSAFVEGGQKARAARGLDTRRFPVESVSWLQAVDFCNRLSEKEGLTSCYLIDGEEVTLIPTGTGYRLPTEAEWEFAARAGTLDRFTFGTLEKWLDGYGWYALNSGDRTHEVGQLRGNPFGLHDVHGNVFEWCYDWYDDKYYSEDARVDPLGPTEAMERRVSRGGAYNKPALECRLTKRRSKPPNNHQITDGFRVVRNIVQ